MCMTIRQNELPRNIFQKILGIQPKIQPLIAKRDIVCYKLYRLTDIPGVVEAPYRLTKHIVGKPQPKVKITYNMWFIFHEKWEIECGYNSFRNKNIENMFKDSSEYVIKKCIIPKGSTYYIGNFRDVRDGYVSNQLIIL